MVPEMPQILFTFECNQPDGISVDFGKKKNIYNIYICTTSLPFGKIAEID